MRLAILGGTFNPIHTGHLALADDVHISLGYDRVLLIPANIPPHKAVSEGATSADRLAMLRLAIEGVSFLGAENCELARGGLSYTIDTIGYLEQKYAGEIEGKIGLVIGEDLVGGFLSWKEAAKIAEKTDIIIAKRPGSPVDKFPYPFIQLANPLLSISSSDIRTNIASSKSWRYLVPPEVYSYIKAHNLYEH